MGIQERLTRKRGIISMLAGAGLVGLMGAAAAPAMAASVEILFEENFNGSSNQFSSEGRVYFNDGYVRLRGRADSTITSDMIYATNQYQTVQLSYLWDSYGLDAGEGVIAEVSVDGGAFTAIRSDQNESGNAVLDLPAASQFYQLRFRLEADSFFERADLSGIRIEGFDAPDCAPQDCGNPGNPPDDAVGATIIPDSTWECGMPGGIPDPTTGELLFTANLPVEAPLEVGQTPYGERTVIPVGGTNLMDTGNGINGEILPGSLDFDLTLPSGAREYESRYTIETSDGELIYMRNCGVADGERVRFVADFEAPNNSNYTWLHQGRYMGVREESGNGIRLSVYRNPTTQEGAEVVQVPSDNTVRQQSWECPTLPAGADSGSEVLEATVGIGGFQTVGDSKYGSRRIIPITGGSFSGDLSGRVNEGGADYQLTINGDLTLEARYTLQTSDGETIVVRNCGDFGSGDLTLPIFEAATAGRYDYLNHSDFVGTITTGLTRVIITVYERN